MLRAPVRVSARAFFFFVGACVVVPLVIRA